MHLSALMDSNFCCTQDDNGHKFIINQFEDRRDAVMKLDELVSHGHKQGYWIEEKIVPTES
jgi:hypothetical protein